jgi:hypothetical protein
LRTPKARRDEFDGGEEVGRILVVAGGDAPELFDLVEEPFDEVALPVQPAGKDEPSLSVAARRNVGKHLLLGRTRPDGGCVVALVGEQDAAARHRLDQGLGLDAVVDLAGSQRQADRAAFGVDKRVDLARKTASGTSHAVIEGPLFAVAPC